MQFLAIMKANPNAPPEKFKSLQHAETIEAWDMAKADIMRTLWFIAGDQSPLGTIALLECADRSEAENQCQKFPFVRNGVVNLEILHLAPCTSYEILFAKFNA